jgi:molybdopterin-biosynthesis enzyme MoeA-like protein
MNIELVTIGTELLLGMTVDTNGAEIARSLAAEGVRVTRRTAVADRPDDIRDAVADALRRTGRCSRPAAWDRLGTMSPRG